MNDVLIDIYVPTYEPNPLYLEEALKSIFNQSEQRFKVWIHDDASKAEVQRMVEKYLKDDRFSFQRSEKNLGIGGNWNTCMQYGEAPYVQYIFQDDTWHPWYLEAGINVFKEYPETGFVSMQHYYQLEGEVPTKDVYESLHDFKEQNIESKQYDGMEFLLWWIQRELHPNMIGEPSFVMMKRDVMKQVGRFNEAMVQFIDAEYWIRLLQVTNWFYVSEHMGTFRVHAQGASMQNFESGKGLYERLDFFESVIKNVKSRTHRKAAIAARNRAIETLVQKFFQRLRNKQKVSMQGSGSARRYFLQHPILIGKAILKSF